MKDWICKKCRKYRRFNPEHLRLGQIICFLVFEIEGVEIKKIIKEGVLLKRMNAILMVLDHGRIFYLKESDVYPIDAPADFVYNMFGECFCFSDY